MSEVLIHGGLLVTMDAARSIGKRDLLLRDGRIAWLGAPGAAPPAKAQRERLDARGALVLPGFVQVHVHLCQVLFRGMADDLPLLAWLRRRIWPLEASHDARSLRISAQLGVAELLRSGTTCIVDMGTTHLHDVVFDVLARWGMRALSGKAMMDVRSGAPKALVETTKASLEESDRLRRRWDGAAQGRLGYAYAPRFILSCSQRLLREVAARVAEGARAHTHVAEHAAERAAVMQRLGMSDVMALRRVGLFGPRVLMAHGVQLTPAEMARLARDETRIAHCPSSNLKLASGVADVVALRRRGVVVGLGADGAPCNNRLDALAEVRAAALLAKIKRKDAAALPALDALALATSEAARAAGLSHQIGSLELGKRGDVVVVDISAAHQAPALDPISSLVYASSGADVRHVVVDGAVRVRSGELLGRDLGRLAAQARGEALRVQTRAGLR